MNPSQSRQGYLRQYQHRRPQVSPYSLYQIALNIWIASHLDATLAELEQARDRIVRECGVAE